MGSKRLDGTPLGALRSGLSRSKGGEKNERPVYRPEPLDWVWGNRALWTLLLLTAAAALSTVRLVELHEGGAITLLSLLPLWLVTYFYGSAYGAVVGAAYGFVRLFVIAATGEWVNFAPGAILLEYPLACGCFALGGLVCKRNPPMSADDVPVDAFGLRAGFLVGVLAMGACYVVSALLYYPPDAEGFLANLWACAVYDMSYLLIEATITEVLICLPQVFDALSYVRLVASTKKGDPTLTSY